MVEKIKKAVERLSRFPRFGASVSEWDREDIREILVGSYRIIYRLRSDFVEIVALIHGARQLPPMPPNP
jgi:plasmid stabilization system protein ParE